MTSPLLEVDRLEVAFPAADGPLAVVRGATFDVGRGEVVGLVGESGSGKTLTALAVLGLVPPPGAITGGRVVFDGVDLRSLSRSAMRKVRGGRIGLVFQEPMSALNPVMSVGAQIVEAIRAHRDVSRRAAREEARRLLELVALPDAGSRLADYPHQLSGGQRQRVVVAMALAAGPELLLADEPTTALDVTVQAQVLDLLRRLQAELGLAVLLITHDLGVVAETCDRVAVMYGGEVVEDAPVDALFSTPAHPYTRGLLAALPKLGEPAPRGELPTIPGQVPEAGRLPSGCAFHPRCPEAFEPCQTTRPPRFQVGAAHGARCLLHAPREGDGRRPG